MIETPAPGSGAPPVLSAASEAGDPYGASEPADDLEEELPETDGPCDVLRLCAVLGLIGTYAFGSTHIISHNSLFWQMITENERNIWERGGEYLWGIFILTLLELCLVPCLLVAFWRMYQLRRWACVFCQVVLLLLLLLVLGLYSILKLWVFTTVSIGLTVYTLMLFWATVCGWKRLINRI